MNSIDLMLVALCVAVAFSPLAGFAILAYAIWKDDQ